VYWLILPLSNVSETTVCVAAGAATGTATADMAATVTTEKAAAASRVRGR